MMEYANISIERYTDLIVELEALKHELLIAKDFEDKYNALARNVFDLFIDNDRHELYSWNREKLVKWGFTVEEIEGLKKEYEDKASRESNSEKNE